MQYRSDKYGNLLSCLGFGCMRWQRSGPSIDLAEAEREVLAAIEGGVNYFDTAYIYPGSEAALGQILAKNGLRDKVLIATKLPHYLIRSKEGLEKLFREQLSRLQTDHVDYYLMHMLNDADTWHRMEALGVREWIDEKKRLGQIRQIGFSYHGNTENFCRLIDAYDWEFCQIQYNYLDEHSQAGRRGLQYAHEKGLPVVIMEPLRGGKLVNLLPQQAKDIMAAHPVRHTPAQWAFRWLWDQPEVTCVLSGMNTLEMVQDNLATADAALPGHLTPEDQAMLQKVVQSIRANVKVGCTGCGYCMPCPKGVDIPGTFAAWNTRCTEGRFAAFREYLMCTALRKTSTAASNCMQCGKCARHCPQKIDIPAELKKASRELEGPLYRIVSRLVRLFKIYG